MFEMDGFSVEGDKVERSRGRHSATGNAGREGYIYIYIYLLWADISALFVWIVGSTGGDHAS